jgi:hypothetical protein
MTAAGSLDLYAELAAAAERVRAAHGLLGGGDGGAVGRDACAELLEAERAYLDLRSTLRERAG